MKDRQSDIIQAIAEVGRLARRSRSIATVERHEDTLKTLLRIAAAINDPRVASAVANTMRVIGLLTKAKPYGVKLASPTGYSLFALNPGMGFSAQRHVTEKLEIFHILKTRPGARVFICPMQHWRHVYDPGRFQEWLAGRRVPEYDRYSIHPLPGDVFHVNRLNLVHTVLGCDLEEYATVSTDLVDRLHDQNVGVAPVPTKTRSIMVARVLEHELPRAQYLVDLSRGGKRQRIPASDYGAHSVTILGRGRLGGMLLRLTAGASLKLRAHAQTARTLRCWSGEGVLTFSRESGDQTASLLLRSGDCIVIVGCVHVTILNVGKASLEVSEQRVSADVALARRPI